jgi:hypothetical protein
MMKISQSLGIGLFGLLFAILLAHHHLDAFTPAHETIWGDAGDGFFNLWILNHVIETLPRHTGNIADGRIFWPDNARSFFWSDNLIAFAPIYATSRLFADTPLEAYRISGILLFFIHFAALLYLFYQGLAILSSRWPQMKRAVWLAPFLAATAQSSAPVLINHYLHIQNFAVAGLFLLLGSMLASLRSNSLNGLPWQVFITLSLLYCTPYYALAAAILLGFWLLGQWSSNATLLKAALWRYRWIWFVMTALALPMVFTYMTAAGRSGMSAAAIRIYAIQWIDLVLPQAGELQKWTRQIIRDYPPGSSEKLAWLGPGLLIATAFLAWPAMALIKKRVRLKSITPLGWFTLISILILIPKTRDLRPFLAWYGVFFIGLGMLYAVVIFARRFRRQPLHGATMYIIIALILFYGIAFGPRTYYVKQPVNPSIWGFFALWVPGFDEMRAIGRMAYPGQVSLILLVAVRAALYAVNLRPRPRACFMLFCMICVVAQLWDSHAIRPPQQRHQAKQLSPTKSEYDFFSKLSGPLLALPAHPFFGNTRHMLFFQPFKKLYLMNGYSGHSTPLWDQIMMREFKAIAGSPEQLQLALATGVDYIAVRTDRIADPMNNSDSTDAYEPLFKNERWSVYRASTMRFHQSQALD